MPLDSLPKEILLRIAREVGHYWAKPFALTCKSIRLAIRELLFEKLEMTPENNNKKKVDYLLKHPDDLKQLHSIRINSFEDSAAPNDKLHVKAIDMMALFKGSTCKSLDIDYLDRAERGALLKQIDNKAFQFEHLTHLEVCGDESLVIVKCTPHLVQVEAKGHMNVWAEYTHGPISKTAAVRFATMLTTITSLRRVSICIEVGGEKDSVDQLSESKSLTWLHIRHDHFHGSSPVNVGVLDDLMPSLKALSSLKTFEMDVKPAYDDATEEKEQSTGMVDEEARKTFCGGPEEAQTAHEDLVKRIGGEMPLLQRVVVGESPQEWEIVERGADGRVIKAIWHPDEDDRCGLWGY